MIRLVFTKIRETFRITLNDRIINYNDKKFPKGFQFLPKDPHFKTIIVMSRNRLPLDIIKWIEDANKGKNLEEYNNAKDDEALAEIVIRDARVNGCVYHGRGKEEIISREIGKSQEIEK